MIATTSTDPQDVLTDDEARSGVMKGGHDPKALSQLGVAARRKKKAEREQQAELRDLTTRQRLAAALSRIDQGDLNDVIDQLVLKAKRGDNASITSLVRLLDQSFGKAVPDAAPVQGEGEGLTFDAMTESQRASYRAALLAEHESLQAEAEPSGDASDPRVE